MLYRYIFLFFYCNLLFGSQSLNFANDIKTLYSSSIIDFVLMNSLYSMINSSQIKHKISNNNTPSKKTFQRTRNNPLLATQRRGIRLISSSNNINDTYDDFYMIAGYLNTKIDSTYSQGYNANIIYNINPNDYLTFSLFASFINSNLKNYNVNLRQKDALSGISLKFSNSIFEFGLTSGFNYGLNYINSSFFYKSKFNHNYIFANMIGGFVLDSGDNSFIKPLIGINAIYSPKYTINNKNISISTNNHISLSAFGGLEFSIHYDNVLFYFFPSYQYMLNPTMNYAISGIQSISSLDVTNGINDYLSLVIGSNFAMTKNSFVFVNGLYLCDFKGISNSFNINIGFKFLI